MGRVRLQPVIQMVLRGFPLEMAEALVELIKLQRIDSGMDELDKLKKNFLRDIEALNGEVSIAKNQLAEAKKKQEELSKTRRGFELEVGTLDSKIKKYTYTAKHFDIEYYPFAGLFNRKLLHRAGGQRVQDKPSDLK